ncbi:MAG: YigZ family protein [Clostridia bacterium]|nr:YigZ family protein [Clostridia bacterium]
MNYLGAFGETSTEKIIEKSRFITYCARTAGEEEAKKFLEKIRARHVGATHVCYGYIADPLGNLQRFSDDGEPQGTAGMPILSVLKAQKLFETSVAVVRYFGGIKLGAGGLTRAYASSAAECVEAAQKRSFETCVEYIVSVAYPEVGACLRFLEGSNAELLKREFGAGAEFTVSVREAEGEQFCNDLISALIGRVSIAEGKKYVYPFAIKKKAGL